MRNWNAAPYCSWARSAAGIALTFMALIGACQSRGASGDAGETANGGATTATRNDTSAGMGGMSGMGAMKGVGGMMDSSMMRMVDSMRISMTRMDAMSPAQMEAMMGAHRQMAANMLAQMNSEMRSMNMSPDPAWTALVDSVRQDLVRLPDVPSSQLKTFMAAHRTRMDRLIAMHREMMGKVPGVPK